MLWFHREIIFRCYKREGMKLQSFIHCIALTLRTAKGLAKEILYEMYLKGYISTNYIELKDFGCDGCPRDITKFSKKACNPRECLIIIQVKRETAIEAIRDEIKKCLSNDITFDTCVKATINKFDLHELDPSLISEAINMLNYQYYYEHLVNINNTLTHSISNAMQILNNLRKETGTINLDMLIYQLLKHLDEINSDNPEYIRRHLEPNLYSLFTILLARGELIYDYTSKQWKYEKKYQYPINGDTHDRHHTHHTPHPSHNSNTILHLCHHSPNTKYYKG
jgi:hypothetical protein